MLHGLSLICLNYRKPALTKILRPLELIKAGFESWWREEALLVQAVHCRSFEEEKKRKQEKTTRNKAGSPLNIHIL